SNGGTALNMSKVFTGSAHVLAIAFVVAIARATVETQGAPQPAPSRPPAAAWGETAFLNQYCTTCHNQRLKTASLSLDLLDVSTVGGDADTWEKVVKKIRTGMMPPSGAKRPDRS